MSVYDDEKEKLSELEQGSTSSSSSGFSRRYSTGGSSTGSSNTTSASDGGATNSTEGGGFFNEKGDTSTSSTSATPSQLSSAEQHNWGIGALDTVTRPGAKTRFQNWIRTNRRRKAIIGGVTGTVVGGALAFFTFAQGPLQLIHLAQILQRPFSSQDDASESRLRGLIRYQRTGAVGETRLSYFGSRSAAKTFERLGQMGVTFEDRTAGGGRPKTIKIDTSKFYPGMSTEDAMEKISRDFRVPPENVFQEPKTSRVGGLVEIRSSSSLSSPDGAIPDRISIRFQYGAVGKIYEGSRIGGAMTALKARPVLAYNGNYSGLHPWKKLGVRSMEQAAKLDEARKARKAERSAKAQERAARLKEKVKPASGIVGVTSAATLGLCVAKDIAHEIPLASYENIRIPARNEALELISAGEQVKSGNDFHVTQPGATVNGLKDKEGKTVWQGKALNAMTYGGAGVGDDLDEDLKKTFSSRNAAADIEKAIDESGGSFLCSTAGQIGLGALGVVALVAAAPSGGSSVATYTAIAVGSTAAVTISVAAVTAFVPKIIGDDPLFSTEEYLAGPGRGNVAAFGAQDLANDFARKSGGAELSNDATAALDRKSELKNRQDFRSKGLFAKLFDVHDYRSAASRVIDNTNPEPSRAVTNIASNLLNIGKSLSDITAAIIPSVSAAEEEKAYSFGFPRYGFSEDDLNNPIMQNPYENASEAGALLAKNPDYIERAKNCFGVGIKQGTYGWEVNLIQNPDGDPELDVIPGTNKYDDSNCAENSDDWLRIRLFIFDSRTMEAYACYVDRDDEACMASGISSTASTTSASEGGELTTAGANVDLANLTQPSESVACAPGTKSVRVQDGYTEGRKVRIRLCELSNLPQTSGYGAVNGKATVNSRVSGAFYAMVEAAKADGISLEAGSSSRTMEEQTALCSGNAACSSGDYTYVAKPGTSNHQLGVAIDFKLGPGIDSNGCINVNGKCTLKGNPSWEWLDKNASKFDLQQYVKEFWHFSPTGS